MNIGRLDKIITIQAFTATQDGYGQAVQTWADWRTVFGTVTFERGDERAEQDRRTATTIVKFTFRSMDVDGIREDYRITYSGDTYDILDILEYGRQDHTTIKAQKKY